MRWVSGPPRKKTKATKTPTKTKPTQVLGGTPAAQADLPSMKTKSQTQKEAFDPTRSLASPRHLFRVGAWNAQTMYETGKTAQVIKGLSSERLTKLMRISLLKESSEDFDFDEALKLWRENKARRAYTITANYRIMSR